MKQSIVSTVLVSLWAALIVAGTFIAIPVPGTPVPIVLQNMLAVMAGMVLGPVLGSASVALFLASGALGLPVFSGARGGLAVLAGPTGGYLLGYLLGALAAGLILGAPREGKTCPLWKSSLAALAGMVFVYIPGLLRLLFVFEGNWAKTLAVGFVPYIVGDLVKTAVMAVSVPKLRTVLVQLRQ